MTIRVLHVGVDQAGTAVELDRRPDLTVESASSNADDLSERGADVDCVVLERQLADEDLLAVLGTIRHHHPDLPVVLVADAETDVTVVETVGPGSATTVRRPGERRVAALASVIADSVDQQTDESSGPPAAVAPSQAIVDTVGDGVYTLDEVGRFTSVNDTMLTMTGYDREELLGEHVSVVLPESDIDESERRIRRLLRGDTNGVETLDINVRTADGETIPCENRFSLLPFDDDFRGTVGVIRDITERQRMESQLRESRDKITQLHEVATELVRCETEMEVYKRAVEAAESILEFDICGIDAVEEEYLVPKYTSSGMPGDGSDRMSIEEGIAGKTYRNGESYRIDDVRTHGDARPVQVEYRSVISVPVGDVGVFQAGSREVGSFDDADVDLAELLMSHVSEALARVSSETALRESEEKYRSLVEQSRDAVFIYHDERFVFVNERTCELTGYDRDELQGMVVFRLIHPDDRDRVRETVRRRFEGQDVPAYETRVVRKDGSVRHFEINAHGITYEGEPAVLGSARDVTERKRRKREIERQNERLEEFASVVSHDLRNPLNVAQGYLDLARESGDDGHFERIDQALGRMEQLVEDLLAQARHGQEVIDAQLLDLGSVAADAWENVATREARLVVADDLPRIEGDENQVLTMLENLFRNAVEHGGTAVTVRVGRTDDGFFVADDGPGIPAEKRAEIFERGYSGRDDGTGLGLAIVRATAKAHGWAIELVDSADGGARFEFET